LWLFETLEVKNLSFSKEYSGHYVLNLKKDTLLPKAFAKYLNPHLGVEHPHTF
jgi:hypothetical protein